MPPRPAPTTAILVVLSIAQSRLPQPPHHNEFAPPDRGFRPVSTVAPRPLREAVVTSNQGSLPDRNWTFPSSPELATVRSRRAFQKDSRCHKLAGPRRPSRTGNRAPRYYASACRNRTSGENRAAVG